MRNSRFTVNQIMAMLKHNEDGAAVNHSCEALAIGVDLSLPSERVIRSLCQIIQWRGKPSAIGCDYRPEYLAKVLVK